MSTLSEDEEVEQRTAATTDTSSRAIDGSRVKRALSVALGAALVIVGLRRRSLGGVLALLAGGGLFYRGLGGQRGRSQTLDEERTGASERTESGRPSRPMTVEQSITIDRPAEELAELWRDPEQLNRIVGPAADVTAAGDERLHWRVNGPLDRTLSWESRIVEDRPGESLRWESIDGAPVPNEGSLRFRPAPADRGTEVTLQVHVDPPGGALGRKAMARLDLVPETLVSQALQRFKSLAETGEIATLERNPSARGRGDLV